MRVVDNSLITEAKPQCFRGLLISGLITSTDQHTHFPKWRTYQRRTTLNPNDISGAEPQRHPGRHSIVLAMRIRASVLLDPVEFLLALLLLPVELTTILKGRGFINASERPGAICLH